MADGIFASKVSATRDANTATNPIFVQLTDGTNVVNVTSNALDVNITTATVTVDFLSEFVDDAAFTVGTSSVTVGGYLADETTPDSVDEGDVGAARMTLDRRQLIVLTDATTESQRLAINANGRAAVDLEEHSLTNTNALPISKDNSANAEANPLYVHNVNTVTSGNEVHDYDTATPAADTADNHDYTVAGTTFLLKSVLVSSSGDLRFEIQTGPVAGLSTVAVGFLTGKEGDTKQINFEPSVEVPATGTGTVRVIRLNRENQANDVYSTIIGNDVA